MFQQLIKYLSKKQALSSMLLQKKKLESTYNLFKS